MLTKKQIVNITILETIKEMYNLTNSDLLKIIMEVKNDNIKKK